MYRISSNRVHHLFVLSPGFSSIAIGAQSKPCTGNAYIKAWLKTEECRVQGTLVPSVHDTRLSHCKWKAG